MFGRKYDQLQPYLTQILERLKDETFESVAKTYDVSVSTVKNLLRKNGIDHSVFNKVRREREEHVALAAAAASVIAEGWKNPERKIRDAYAAYLMGRTFGDGCGGMTYEAFKAREARI